MIPDPAAGLERHLAANASSPLFARLADALARRGEHSRAAELCERGLQVHPEYTTGHLVHARCLAARGDFRAAVDALSIVIPSYPGNILLGQLEEEWSSRIDTGATPQAGGGWMAEEDFVEAAGETILAEPARPDPLPEDVVAGEAVPPESVAETPPEPPPKARVEPQAAPPAGSAPAVRKTTPTVPDDAIAFLGGESHPSPVLQSPTGFVERDRIISRTLAEIYASQGAVREAVETYRLLMERIPDRREEFGKRLRELEERLRLHPEGPKISRE